MSIHIGETIKNLVKNKGISVTEFADRINNSRRNVYEIFDKKTIDTGLLIKIGKVLEQNLFLLYVSEKDISEHQVSKKSANEEFIQTVDKLKGIVNDLSNNVDSLKSHSLPKKSEKQKSKKTIVKEKSKTKRY